MPEDSSTGYFRNCGSGPFAPSSGTCKCDAPNLIRSTRPTLARFRCCRHPHPSNPESSECRTSPRLSISGLISRNDTTLAFVGNGIDPRIDITASTADDLVDGQPLDEAAPNRIQLGEGLAASLGVKPGDSAVLLVNLPGGGINAADVTVAGIFRTVSKSYDDAALRVPLALAHTLLKTRGADVWIISLDRTDATEQTISALRGDPALAGLSFVPWMSLADFYNKAVVLYARQFSIMQTLIAVIIVLSILNTMMMSVAERTWEIGTMMAMGTPRRAILRMFLFEGAILGIIGGVAGVALGLVVNTLVSAIGIPMPPPPGMRQGFVAEASFSAGVVLWAFVLAVIATTFASVFPAVRSSRLVIVDALRTSH